MSELVAATPEAVSERRALLRRLSPWTIAVALSALVLAAAAAALGGWWLASVESTTTTSRVGGVLQGVELRVQSGDVTIVGGGQSGVSVSRSDRSVYGQRPTERRRLAGGILRLDASCPRIVLGSCSSTYRIALPDNVPISIRAANGSVRLESFRGSADIATNSGSITVDGYCGFVLGAASASGDISVVTSCSPERLALRSSSGNVSATVPSGNYRVNAISNSGRARVLGLVNDSGAPWGIEALSNSGAVTVAAGS